MRSGWRLRQAVVVFEREPLGHEPRLEQQGPEPVGEAGEVMSRHRRANAGIDADEERADARLDAIA
jgi:hypothetical protein